MTVAVFLSCSVFAARSCSTVLWLKHIELDPTAPFCIAGVRTEFVLDGFKRLSAV